MQILKKISNWTFGGMFRTIGRILAYIIVGLIISILLMKSDRNILRKILGIETVMAASANYSSTTSQVHAIRPSDGDIMWTTLISPGNTTNVGQYRYIQEFAYRIYGGSNTYTNGNTYTATFTFTIANSGCTSTACFTEFENNIRNNYYVIRVSGNTASQHDSNTSADNIASFSYTIAKTPTKGQYRLTVNMIPKVNLKFFIVYFYSKFGEFSETSGSESDYVNITSYTYNSLSFSYTEGTNAVLTNQTGVIQQQTDIIIQQNEEIIDSLTGEDSNPESKKCGIICKLKHIVSFLKVENLINIIIPTEQQMEDLFEQFQEGITEKLGILGLPVTVYTNIMHLVDNTTENNWCFNWDGVTVPNFENYTIIQAGQYCFSDMLSNNKIKALRDFSITFSGALILLAFIQFLKNMLHRVLDVPDRDEYTYFTQEDVYTINNETGEVTGHQVKNRSTYREVR